MKSIFKNWVLIALKFPWNRSAMKYERYKSDFKKNFSPLCPHFSSKQYLMGLISIVFTFCLACVAACSSTWSVPHDVAYFVVNSGALFKVKVIYFGVLTTKPLEDRKFQFFYIHSLFSNTQFIRKQNGLKLQFLRWIGQFDKIVFIFVWLFFTMGNFFDTFHYAF